MSEHAAPALNTHSTHDTVAAAVDTDGNRYKLDALPNDPTLLDTLTKHKVDVTVLPAQQAAAGGDLRKLQNLAHKENLLDRYDAIQAQKSESDSREFRKADAEMRKQAQPKQQLVLEQLVFGHVEHGPREKRATRQHGGLEVHSDKHAALADLLERILGPRPGKTPQIDHPLSVLEQAEPALDLGELEDRPSLEALLFRLARESVGTLVGVAGTLHFFTPHARSMRSHKASLPSPVLDENPNGWSWGRSKA